MAAYNREQKVLINCDSYPANTEGTIIDGIADFIYLVRIMSPDGKVVEAEICEDNLRPALK